MLYSPHKLDMKGKKEGNGFKKDKFSYKLIVLY